MRQIILSEAESRNNYVFRECHSDEQDPNVFEILGGKAFVHTTTYFSKYTGWTTIMLVGKKDKVDVEMRADRFGYCLVWMTDEEYKKYKELSNRVDL